MKMKKKLIIPAIIIPILIFFVIVNNYSKNVERSLVAGTYIANYDKLKSTLVIKEDGTYDYYFEIEDGEKYFNSNKWRFDNSGGESSLMFSGFKYGIMPYLHNKEDIFHKSGSLKTPIISNYDGQIKIIINEDLGLYYFKQ